MKTQIKGIYGDVLFEYETTSVKECLIQAVKSRANLSGADLSGADLSRANLYGASLYGADLSGASLYGADLSGASLYGADLSGASLSGADLYGADLYGADLSGANLSGADLYGADLSGANLSGADLSGANLSRAKDVELVIAKTRILPEGDLIVYKKVRTQNGSTIAKLLIPKEAKRSSAFGRKCRAEYADVLEIEGSATAFSSHDKSFTYEVGKRVTPVKPFSDNWQEECESGIHFFITRLEAEKY